MEYKKTVLLPKTDFPQRANLKENEAKMQKKWAEDDIYKKIREARKDAPKYILHDGPPYATGEVHIGTVMNKILKDFVVKYKTMRGFDSPYVPGWDCHGLPIEHKVMQEVKDKIHDMPKHVLRSICRDYANKFVKRQREQFMSFHVFGDWYNPYLTMTPQYEEGIIDVFAKLVAKDYVFRSLKPIHWCMGCETALAEAELEYEDITGPSIYIKFPLEAKIKEHFPEAGDKVNFLVWTTTPWTLPANLAIALHPTLDYTCFSYTNTKNGNTEFAVMADTLIEKTMELAGCTDVKRLGTVRGKELEGLTYTHLLMGREGKLILAEYVSAEDGTGAVHIAPGHGQEDYVTGLQVGLEVLSPVDSKGCFTSEAGEWEGMNVNDANPKINAKLEELGALLYETSNEHSYPHCWRCKQPVIFRATEQWFIGMDRSDLRGEALKAVKETQWVPEWGEIRIENMITDRPDWCISRQRSWGVPIPAFYCKKCNYTLMTKETVEHTRDVFAEKGADSWFELPAKTFMPEGTKCPECGGTEFDQGGDIFDVWFESGASHRSVCIARDELSYPADLYLEGSDQYRGWFQLSLLPSVGAYGQAPYKTVLTHGFVQGEDGRPMSKSIGNFVAVDEVLAKFGGDIMRLWCSSVDYRSDIPMSTKLIERIQAQYRKVRNTFRFLMGNIHDFDASKHAVPHDQMEELDRWALAKLEQLLEEVYKAYDKFEFHRVFTLTHNFCVTEMSSFYLDILKDRLYCDKQDSPRRRSCQTAMNTILSSLTRLLAPILTYTCEEIWQYLPESEKQTDSVHTSVMKEIDEKLYDKELLKKWDILLKVRVEVSRELEKLRETKVIGNALGASVTLSAGKETMDYLNSFGEDNLSEKFIVSQLKLSDEKPEGANPGIDLTELFIKCEKSELEKCERCWNFRETVGQNSEHPTLCARCADAVTE